MKNTPLSQRCFGVTGGCRLPCWWGFTPGETSWQTTKTFFALLGKTIEAWRGHDTQQHYAVYFDIPEHRHFHYQGYHEKDGVLDRIGIHAVPPVHDDEFVYVDSQFIGDWRPYMLPQILGVYGPPSHGFPGCGS